MWQLAKREELVPLIPRGILQLVNLGVLFAAVHLPKSLVVADIPVADLHPMVLGVGPVASFGFWSSLVVAAVFWLVFGWWSLVS